MRKTKNDMMAVTTAVRAAHRMRQRGVTIRRRAAEGDQPDRPAKDDCDHLAERRRHRQDQNRGADGKCRTRGVRSERAHHGQHGIGDDCDGGNLQSMQPAAAQRAAERPYAVAEQSERDSGWHGESGPRRQCAGIAGA